LGQLSIIDSLLLIVGLVSENDRESGSIHRTENEDSSSSLSKNAASLLDAANLALVLSIEKAEQS
jgi:hypothetical protein